MRAWPERRQVAAWRYTRWVHALFMALAVCVWRPAAAQKPYPPLARPPQFSSDTLGGMTFAHVTKSYAFNITDLEFLRRFPIVQFDKGQDAADMPLSTLEDRFIAAARQVKQVNPDATLLMYLNGLINFAAFQRLYNATQGDPSLLLRNNRGKLVQTLAPSSISNGTFDMRRKSMRDLFVSDAKYGVESGAFDGVFIDRANFAARALLDLEAGNAHLLALGWDIDTTKSLIAGQTQLFADLMTTLGDQRVILAKETGGGAAFEDWRVANAAMVTDTFCSNYAPRSHAGQPPVAYTGNASCSSWSVAVKGHVALHGATIWDGQNESSMARCEEACCHAGTKCAAVLYNTEIQHCVLLNQSYTAQKEHFTCMKGKGVEWVSNKHEPGSSNCTDKPPPPPNPKELFNASQCKDDMTTVATMAARGQLTENHGQGPLDDAVQRQFTMACFLIAAGNYSYFSYAGWGAGEAWSLQGTRWWPEYDLPLGVPIDPPMSIVPGASPDSMKYFRRFASGTRVELDLLAHTAAISWAGSS